MAAIYELNCNTIIYKITIFILLNYNSGIIFIALPLLRDQVKWHLIVVPQQSAGRFCQVVFVMISQDPPHPQGHQPRSRFLQMSVQYSIQFHEYLIGGSCLLYFLRSFPSSFSTGFKENVVRIRNITKRRKILRVIKKQGYRNWNMYTSSLGSLLVLKQL